MDTFSRTIDASSDPNPRELIGWIPCHLDAPDGHEPARIRWQFAGDSPLDDSFFSSTPERLARENPGYPVRYTSLNVLRGFASASPALSVTAFIFHMGRCGSTALANALRTVRGAVSLSEPTPLGDLLKPEFADHSRDSPQPWAAARTKLFRGMLNAYAARRRAGERRLFVKFLDWNALDLKLVQAIWPETPIVFMYRDPVEVIYSHLCTAAAPSVWLIVRSFPPERFGMDPSDVLEMSIEEYYARILCSLCDSAAEIADSRTILLDYADFGVESVMGICARIGMAPSDLNADRIRDALKLYSKDVRRSNAFVPDSARKRAGASEHMREMATLYALPAVNRLRAMEAEFGWNAKRAEASPRKMARIQSGGPRSRAVVPDAGRNLREPDTPAVKTLELIDRMAWRPDLAALDPPVAALAAEAFAARAAGRREEAVRLYRAAIAGDPSRGTLHFLLGRVIGETGDPAGALDEFLTAERLGIEDVALDESILTAYMDLGRIRDAEIAVRRWLAADPLSIRNCRKLAAILQTRGERVESTLLLRLIASTTSAAEDYTAWADALLRSDRASEARDIFLNGLNLYPASEALNTGLRNAQLALDHPGGNQGPGPAH
jgi:tetratricopeptide (TPR) repeat protein